VIKKNMTEAVVVAVIVVTSKNVRVIHATRVVTSVPMRPRRYHYYDVYLTRLLCLGSWALGYQRCRRSRVSGFSSRFSESTHGK